MNVSAYPPYTHTFWIHHTSYTSPLKPGGLWGCVVRMVINNTVACFSSFAFRGVAR
jgi:hypothetical protein